jgi:hypothetical protein
MRFALMVPYYKVVPSKTAISLVNMIISLKKGSTEFAHFSIDQTYIDLARETLARDMLKMHAKSPFDWAFHIDSDQSFTPKQAWELLADANTNNFPILSGIYFQRENPLPVFMYLLDDKTRKDIAKARHQNPGEITGKYVKPAVIPEERYFTADVCGFGFMVCKPKVYEDILQKFGKPIFDIERDEFNTLRDDVRWCEKARACDYKIVMDNAVRIGHEFGATSYRDFRAWRAEKYLEHKKMNEAYEKTKELIK